MVDRKLFSDLESVRGDRAEHNDPKRTDADYAAAFRQAGLDLDRSVPEAAGAWIAGHSAPIELASFLDDWAKVRSEAGGDEEAVGHLVGAARAADADPWRDALRAGLGTKAATALEALHKLAGDEKALEAQPAESLRLLAKRLKAAGDRDGATRLLAGSGGCDRTTSGSTSSWPYRRELRARRSKRCTRGRRRRCGT